MDGACNIQYSKPVTSLPECVLIQRVVLVLWQFEDLCMQLIIQPFLSMHFLFAS